MDEVAEVGRRSLRRAGAGDVAAGGPVRLPVVVRPSWFVVGLVAVLSVVQPSRREPSLLLTGIAQGPLSRLALLSYTVAFAGLALAALLARSFLALQRGEGGRTVVVHQGLWRRREFPVSGLGVVLTVNGPSRRTLLLGRDGELVGVIGTFSEFWRRGDVFAVLRAEGVRLDVENRVNGAAELEAAHPGSTVWIERTKVRLFVVVVPTVLVLTVLLAWAVGG